MAPLGAEGRGDGARRPLEQLAAEHHVAHQQRGFALVNGVHADVVDQRPRVGTGVERAKSLGAAQPAAADQGRLQARLNGIGLSDFALVGRVGQGCIPVPARTQTAFEVQRRAQRIAFSGSKRRRGFRAQGPAQPHHGNVKGAASLTGKDARKSQVRIRGRLGVVFHLVMRPPQLSAQGEIGAELMGQVAVQLIRGLFVHQVEARPIEKAATIIAGNQQAAVGRAVGIGNGLEAGDNARIGPGPSPGAERDKGASERAERVFGGVGPLDRSQGFLLHKARRKQSAGASAEVKARQSVKVGVGLAAGRRALIASIELEAAEIVFEDKVDHTGDGVGAVGGGGALFQDFDALKRRKRHRVGIDKHAAVVGHRGGQSLPLAVDQHQGRGQTQAAQVHVGRALGFPRREGVGVVFRARVHGQTAGEFSDVHRAAVLDVGVG